MPLFQAAQARKAELEAQARNTEPEAQARTTEVEAIRTSSFTSAPAPAIAREPANAAISAMAASLAALGEEVRALSSRFDNRFSRFDNRLDQVSGEMMELRRMLPEPASIPRSAESHVPQPGLFRSCGAPIKVTGAFAKCADSDS